MIVLLNGCFTTDFAFEIFKQHFSQKGIFTEFLDAPLDFFHLLLSIFCQIWLSYIWKAALQTYWAFFLFDEFCWSYSRLNSLQKYAVAMTTQFGENQNCSIGL